MKSIQISNFRSINESSQINLKPLNILLGANSSGKSSFLRIFPLIKQSFEVSTSAPLLWYGRLVDFGSINTSKTRSKENMPIIFKFGFDFDFDSYSRTSGYYYPGRRAQGKYVPVKISISLEGNIHDKSYISSFDLSFFDINIHLSFSEDGKVESYQIDNYNILDLVDAQFYINNNSIIPDLMMHYQLKENYKTEKDRHFDPITEALLKSTRSFVHANASDERIRYATFSADIGSTAEMIESFSRGFGWSKAKREKIINSSEKFYQFKALLFAHRMQFILSGIKKYFEEYFNNNFYIGPSRAIGKRYYRQQDLAINEVDYQGENLAMYLRYLSDHELEMFNTFCSQYFDFTTSVNSQAGHTSIVISEHNGPYINMIDLGFGYSQMLPVIVQLWHALHKQQSINKRRGPDTSKMITIEQPELHLHPKFQGRLADLFMGSINESKQKNKDYKMIIETHSEALINGIGHLINQGKMSNDDVQILVFQNKNDLNPVDSGTEIRRVSYNENGQLLNWPFGFFSSFRD